MTAELRRIRESQGESLRSIAKKAGVSGQHISDLERGRASPSIALVPKLAKAYGIPVHYAMTLFLDDLTDSE